MSALHREFPQPLYRQDANTLYSPHALTLGGGLTVGGDIDLASNNLKSVGEYQQTDGDFLFRVTTPTAVHSIELYTGTDITNRHATHNATVRVWGKGTDASDNIAFYHNDTDGVIGTGAGNLKFVPASNIDANSKRILNVSAATTSGDALSYGQASWQLAAGIISAAAGSAGLDFQSSSGGGSDSTTLRLTDGDSNTIDLYKGNGAQGPLVLENNDAEVKLRIQTTAAAAVTNEPQIQFAANTSSGVFEIGRIELNWSNTTHASRTGQIAIYNYNSGTEVNPVLIAGNSVGFPLSGAVTVGTDDTVSGQLRIYGHTTGSTVGGELRLYTAADHDTSIEYYSLQATSDDFAIVESGGTSRIKVWGGGGDISLNPAGNVNVNANLITNVTDPVSAQDAATKNYIDDGFVRDMPANLWTAGTVGTPTKTTLGTGADAYEVWQFSDSVNEDIISSVTLPAWIVTSFVPYIYYSVDATPSAGTDVFWQLYYRYVGDGEQVDDTFNGAFSEIMTAPGTVDDLSIDQIGVSPLTAAVDGDFIRLMLRRVGANAADDLIATINFHAIVWRES